MAKRKRRAFTEEFKAQAVGIARDRGKTGGAMARELDLTETALRSWVWQAEIDAGRGAPGALTTEEREELGRLRRENRPLRMEGDFLKRATASSRKRTREVHVHCLGEDLGMNSPGGRSQVAANLEPKVSRRGIIFVQIPPAPTPRRGDGHARPSPEEDEVPSRGCPWPCA